MPRAVVLNARIPITAHEAKVVAVKGLTLPLRLPRGKAKAAKTTQIVVVDAAEGNDLVLIWAMSAEANLFQAIAVQISKSFTWKSSFCVVKAWLRQLPLFKWVGAKL